MSDVRLNVVSLAARGYCGGDPERILEMSVDMFVDLLAWVTFERDFSLTKAELNKPKEKRP
jgi:hypothetical protein